MTFSRKTAVRWWWCQSDEHFFTTCYDSPNGDKSGYHGPFDTELDAIFDYIKFLMNGVEK